MTMPPATGSAPPDRPVPWPRATNGTPARRRTAARSPAPRRPMHGRTTARRRFAQVRQRVALVGQQLERVVEHAGVADNPTQLREKCAIDEHVQSTRRAVSAGSLSVAVSIWECGLKVERRDFLLLRARQPAVLSCEPLFMRFVDAQADGASTLLFESLAADLGRVNAIRVTDASWLARADLKSRLDAVLDAFRAAGGTVTFG